MKILVIAPHPDDEVLGCGGTIAKHSENGDDVYLIIATKAYTPDWTEEFIKNREREIKESNKILGIKKTYFLNYPTVKLDTIPQKELNDSIVKIVNKIKPDIAYIPFKGDLNKDHRLLFEASLVALRPIHHKVKKILSYEILSETEWGQEIEVFKPNVYVDITKTFNKKIEAMKAYGSELREFPHPRSLKAMEALAIKRGSEIGVKYAESFYLIREIQG
jgi:LmbE family N-acetylglucosaminyl deacetylase